MKLVYPKINSIIEICDGKINSLIVENPTLLFHLISDMKEQLEKKDGLLVISKNNEPIEIYKEVELLTDVYGVDLNSKSILNKISDELIKKSVNETYYESTMQTISSLETYFQNLTWDMECELACDDVIPKQLFKAFGFKVVDDSTSFVEHLLKYLILVRQYLGDKLFVFLNFRGFIGKTEFDLLSETLLQREFKVLFIDNKEYPKVVDENRSIIDIDLCEF